MHGPYNVLIRQVGIFLVKYVPVARNIMMLSNSFLFISTFANIHNLYRSIRGVCGYDNLILFTSPKIVVYMYS